MIFERFIRSFSFAISGIAYAFRSQFNMRFHVVAACMVLIAAFFFRLSPFEWCIILFCIASVISAELINTSIETSIDLSSPGLNQKAGQAKDLAAAAVLVTSLVSAIIGLIVFAPKIINLL